MKACGNHLWVGNQQSRLLKINDSNVASMFHMPSVGLEEVTLNYVGVVKDIVNPNWCAHICVGREIIKT